MIVEVSKLLTKVKVVILEDHQSIIDGYSFRFSHSEYIQVIGTVSYGVDLEPLLALQPTNVVFLDVSVPTALDNLNPYPILHAIPRLRQLYPDLVILVISMLTERGLITAVMEAGANGYILKDDREAIKGLEQIVLNLLDGQIYISKQAQLQFPDRVMDQELETSLTRRQLEILSLCGAYPDLSLQNIAQKLSIEHSTVRNTLSQAYFRLGVPNLASAVLKARRLGLITPNDR